MCLICSAIIPVKTYPEPATGTEKEIYLFLGALQPPFLPTRNENEPIFLLFFFEVEDNGKTPKMTSVNSPIDENLPDGVQRTTSNRHMWFIQQGTTPMETTIDSASARTTPRLFT